MCISIEESRGISPHPKEKGMSEIHLTSKAGKQIPACCKYGKDTGEGEDAKKVGVFGKQRQEEEKEKKQHHDHTGWENKCFVFEYGK
jgi:hypothetical protein